MPTTSPTTNWQRLQQERTRTKGLNNSAKLNRSPTPAEAAQHLLNRRNARRSVIDFAGFIEVPGRPLSDDPDCELFRPVETNLVEHHKLMLSALEETANTRYGRLMLLCPPGSAKSTYASVVFPSHYLGKNPEHKIIAASYGADLARKMGRRTRSIIRQPRYQRIFDCALSQDSSAADQFLLTNGSEYMATGLLGSLTGNRAHGGIIDDPLPGREEAESEVQRQKTWDAYNDDFLTRLVPGGWVVIIMTRWHHDDIAGRILPEDWNGESGYFDCRDGRKWRVLALQAKCETASDPLGRQIGQYLWPEWFDTEHWTGREKDQRSWNSLYQQRPRPLQGSYFTDSMLLVSGQPMDEVVFVDGVFAVIDTAIKTGKQNDGLAVTFFGVSKFGTLPEPIKLVVLDWDITQIDAAFLQAWIPTVFTKLEELAKTHKARMGSFGVWIEDKGSGTILLQQIQSNQQFIDKGWRAHPIDTALTAMGKVERAVNVSGYVIAGMVKFFRKAWEKVVTYKDATRNHLVFQILSFMPSTKDMGSDDCLDTFTYGCAIGLGNREGF